MAQNRSEFIFAGSLRHFILISSGAVKLETEAFHSASGGEY
jgi:hypothetical protein